MTTAHLRLLYIDDESSIREMTLHELSRHGVEVSVASSGEEGLALFRRSPFPVVACDLKMPGISGLEVLRTIKGIDPDTEVLIATGFGSQDDAVTCLKAGAYDYIYKPFNMTEFLVLIRRAWERRSLKAHLVLYQCLQAASRSLDPDVVLDTVTQGLRTALLTEDVVLTLADGRPDLDSAVQPTGHPLEQEQIVDGEKRCALTISLQGREGALGWLTVRRPGACPSFSESDKRALVLFAHHAAGAIENARLHQALRNKLAELQETREQLIQSEKLSALGRLAAGVAHEINNPLTGILGQAQLLLLTMPHEAPYREDIAFIESSAQRCRTVVQNLLQFSRRHKMERQPVDLWENVHQAMLFVKKSFSLHNIVIQESCEENLPPLFASPVHLTQVLLNLFQNAFDAMGTEGTLQIRAFRQEATVRLLVTDSGPGIAPEVLPHIFEPFFTTKEVGQGTGLGLAISLGIMRDHGGALEVASPPPGETHGTEFALVLPIPESPRPASVDAEAPGVPVCLEASSHAPSVE
jgi:signal transduction histidine kinase